MTTSKKKLRAISKCRHNLLPLVAPASSRLRAAVPHGHRMLAANLHSETHSITALPATLIYVYFLIIISAAQVAAAARLQSGIGATLQHSSRVLTGTTTDPTSNNYACPSGALKLLLLEHAAR